MDDDAITILTSEECWELLREEEFGRLAFHMAEEVHIAPVNYAVDGDKLVFRTAEGSKLLGVVMNPDVAFEIDRYDDRVASSVIVRGRARRLEEYEEGHTDQLRLRPWVPSLRYDFVEITATQVSGRRFLLERPWLHHLPEQAR